MSRTSRKKKISIIQGIRGASVDPQEISSAYLLFLKQQKKGYIAKYLQQLPQTYTTSSGIVKNVQDIKDIREKEVKNTTLFDPANPNQDPMISSEEGVIKDKKYYRVPMFHKVKHHQRLTKAFEQAYSDFVKKAKPKPGEMIMAHQKAFEAGLEAMNQYAQWVFKNNEKLVKDFPEYFSFEKSGDKVPVKKESKKILDSLKSLFKGW